MLRDGLGFNLNPHGLFCDSELAEVLRFDQLFRTDWVHDELQGGVFSQEVKGLTRACRAEGIYARDFKALMECDWKFPRHNGVRKSDLAAVFHNKLDEGKKVKAKASDFLSLFALLRHICELMLRDKPNVQAQKASFEASCDVLDLYQKAKRDGPDNLLSHMAALRAAQSKHMQLHTIAYGSEYVLPKHHARGHVPEYDDFCFDMFVVERLNLRLKKLAEPVCCTASYERSILSSLLTKHQNQLATAGKCLLPGLLGRVVPLPNFVDVLLGRGVAVGGRALYVDDVIHSGNTTGLIVACVFERGGFAIVVQSMQQVPGTTTRNSGTFRLADELQAFSVGEATEAAAWYLNLHGQYVVVR
jgi:hypothetical protein